MARKLIYNASIVNEGEAFHGYVLINGQFIEEVGHGEPSVELIEDGDIEKTDAAGVYLIPGLIDEHVHFREPGLTFKGDIESESKAALAGGVTSFIDMPNTVPPTVTMERLEEKMAIASRTSSANYGFFIGATRHNIEELKTVDYSRVAGVKLFLGSSTGDMAVEDAGMVERIFAEVPALIAVHAEDNGGIAANVVNAKKIYGGYVPVSAHPEIRSREACLRSTEFAISVARRHGARLHVMHISTADELGLFTEDIPIEEKCITCETCPQYLTFDSSDYVTRGARVKCNPAIKDAADRESLVEAVESGRIDTIGTDHAPHLLVDKEGDALHASSGMPVIQFALPLLGRVLPIEIIVTAMAHNPAKIYGIDRRGFIRPGYYADIVMVRHLETPVAISDKDVISRCGWTPADGIETPFKVEATWVNGVLSYTATHGFLPESAACPLKFRPSN